MSFINLLKYLVFFILILTGNQAFSSIDGIVFDGKNLEIYQITKENHRVGLEEVQSRKFETHRAGILSYNSSYFWIRTTVKNTSDESRHIVFRNLYSGFSAANFYVVDKKTGDVIARSVSGTGIPKKEWTHDYRSPGVNISFAPGQAVEVYIEYQTRTLRILNHVIFSQDEVKGYEEFSVLALGLYVGLVIGLLIYLGFYYLSASGFSKISLALPLIASIGGLFIQTSLLSGYFWPYLYDFGLYFEDYFPTLRMFTISGQAYFLFKFLEVETHNPKFGRFFRGFIWSTVAIMVVTPFVEGVWIHNGFEVTAIVFVVLATYAVFRAFTHSRRQAVIFLLSFSPVFAIFIAFFMILIGFSTIEAANLGLEFSYFACGGQILFISIGVARFADEQRVAAEEKIEALNKRLEGEVAERTKELNNTLIDLKKGIEERDRVQKELDAQRAAAIDNSKFTALGEMAGGIAHEINNPLAVIRGQAEFLRISVEKGVNDSYKIAKSLRSIETMAGRISKIIGGLRMISRNAEHDSFESVTVQSILEDTLSLCQAKLRHLGVQFSYDIAGEDEALAVMCREVQVSQVLLNLFNNSVDAIEGRKEKWIQVNVMPDGKMIVLTFTDSGSGIPGEVVEKMMQPFFTTKEVGKGTGLGLSISRQIMQEHGGDLRYNKEHSNTQFILSLKKA